MKRILFAMSDTGGGHRAAAIAISDALKSRHSGDVDCQIVDIFKHYTPFPFKNFPEYYPKIIKGGSSLYGAAFKLSDTPRRAQLVASALYAVSYRQLRQLAQDYSADAIVSTHSIITRPTFRAMSRKGKCPLLFTVVVDLVSTHMFWYDKRTDVFLLPTQSAYERGLKAGVAREKMYVTGIPVHPNFVPMSGQKITLREQLGWNPYLPTVLLTGGGDGMGKLYEIAQSIISRQLPLQLVIITGRNQELKQALSILKGRYPVQLYSFVDNMYELMGASDLLITKAGSLTISEACVIGLPMLLYNVLPGQEEGNENYIVKHGAGYYAPSNKTMLARIEHLLLNDQQMLETYTNNAKRLGHPEAVWTIADIIWQNLDKVVI